MTVTFTGTPHFLSVIESLFPQMPPPTSMMTIGENGKRYVLNSRDVTAARHQLFNIDDGAVQQIGWTNFTTNYPGANWSSDWTTLMSAPFASGAPNCVFAVPGAPFFFVQDVRLSSPTMKYGATRYKIAADGSFVYDGGFGRRFDNDIGNGTFWPNVSGAIGNYAYLGWANINDSDQAMLNRFPLSGTDVDLTLASDWGAEAVEQALGEHFYDTNISSAGSYQARGCVIEYGGKVGTLTLIRAQEIADTSGNAIIDGAAGPFVVWCSWDGDIQYFTSEFGLPFSDSNTNKAGASTSYNTSSTAMNDYFGPSSFKVDDDWYVVFVRPYSDASEYFRIRAFAWNDGAPSLINDVIVKAWDAVTDGGASEANRNATHWKEAQTGFDPNTNELIICAGPGDGGPFDEHYLFAVGGGFAGFAEPVDPTPEPGDDDVPVVARTIILPKVRQLLPFEKPPFAEYRVGNPRAAFPFKFFVFDLDDLRVTVDDVETEDFTFAGVVTPFPGYDDTDLNLADPLYKIKNAAVPGYRGGVVMLDAPVEDCIVRIWLEPPAERIDDLTSGQITGRALNRAFGDLWAGYRALSLGALRHVVVFFDEGTLLSQEDGGSIVVS